MIGEVLKGNSCVMIKSEESFRNILCGLGREERVGLGVSGDPSGTGPERDPFEGI